MDNETSDDSSKNKSGTAQSAHPDRIELIKIILDFISKGFYPGIFIVVITLLYPAISEIDLKGLISRLHSAKAGDYEFAFNEELKAEGSQAAETNGTIEQLKLKVAELSQDVAELKKATPTASPSAEQATARKEKERQFADNSEYSILIFYKPYQKEMATLLTTKLLALGFKSSATPTDLKESVKQFDENTAWVIYTEKGKEKLASLQSILPSVSGRLSFVYREDAYSLRSGDVQILLF